MTGTRTRLGRWRTATVALLVALGLQSAAPAPASAAGEQQIADLLQQMVDEGAVGAMALIENSSGTTMLARGKAVDMPADGGPDLDPRMRFRIGSITKTFTATLALQLADAPFPVFGRPKLDLDATIDRYLQPEPFPPPGLPYLAQLQPGLVARSNEITVRQLMTHTSGLADYYENYLFDVLVFLFPELPRTPLDLAAAATGLPAHFAPGQAERWYYSNLDYVLLGLVVEKATGVPVARLVQDWISGRLGLGDTSFPVTADMPGDHAHGYVTRGLVAAMNRRFVELAAGTGQPPFQLPVPPDDVDVTRFNPSLAGSAGALVSSLANVRTFFKALLSDGTTFPALLSPRMRTAILDDSVPVYGPVDGVWQQVPNYRYGLGLDRTSGTPCAGGATAPAVWGHGGRMFGYETYAFSSRDGKYGSVIAVTSQTDASPIDPYSEAPFTETWRKLQRASICRTHDQPPIP